MRRYFFELLALVLLAGSLVFFRESIEFLGQRDYIAAVIVMLIGIAVITVGKEMARLALAQKD